jgi:hypothetical protein
MVRVALLNGIEAVGNGNPTCQLCIVRFEVHQGNSQQGRRSCDVQINSWTLFYAGTFRLVRVICADHTLRRLNHFPALDKADQTLLQLEVSK